MENNYSGVLARPLNEYIDHTLLSPSAGPDDIIRLCEEAARYHFASVCVNPCYVPLAADRLRGTGVKVCTVVGFPLGQSEPRIKVEEAEYALERGALEIDMVMNVGMFKAGAAEFHANEVRAIAEEVHKREGAILKVILETCLLTPEQIAEASVISGSAGADFVKTSTGFSTGGATVEAVRTMAEALASAGLSTRIKASGGIRTLGAALAMIEAGADRLGASAGAAIMAEAEKEGLA